MFIEVSVDACVAVVYPKLENVNSGSVSFLNSLIVAKFNRMFDNASGCIENLGVGKYLISIFSYNNSKMGEVPILSAWTTISSKNSMIA